MTTRKRFAGIALALALVAGGAVLAQEIAGGLLEMRAARDAMADRDWPRAEQKLSALIDQFRTGDRVEEAHVLLLRAKTARGDFEGALATGRTFLSSFAGSPRERKVRSLMADAWVRMRDFKDAALVWREETDFLSGDAHLAKVAGYYLDLARPAFEGIEQPDEFGRPVVVKDFARALAYYRKAREILVDEEKAPMVSHRIAASLAETGDAAGAVAEWKSLLEKWPDSPFAAEARFRIGEALVRIGDRVQARKYYREVLDLHADTEWAPLARLSLGGSYDPLGTRDEADLDRGLKEWREFLRLYPSHAKAEETAWLIGDAEFRFGRYDAAIAALGAFLEAHPEGEHAPDALNRIALAWFRKGDFDRAAAEWKRFLGRWPNHELWTKVQAAITESAWQKGAHPLGLSDTAPEKERPELYDRAERGFRAFLAEYPVDARAAQAQYLLGEIDSRRKDFAGAIEEWRIAAQKYVDTPSAPSALFRIAAAYENDLKDLGKAIAGYEDLVAKYGDSSEARAAAGLLEQFRKKLLEVTTERVRRTDEPAALKIRTRNIENLKIRAWPVNLEDRFRLTLSLAEMEKVAVEILVPALEATVATEGYEKYRLFERELPLDLAGPGAWIVSVQDEDLTATTLLVVSDLTLVTKSARGQQLAFAVNERTGERFPGVRVLVGASGKVVAEGKTNEDGLYVREGKEGAGEVSFFAEAGGHVAFTGLAGAAGTSFGYSSKAYLYTDRPLYRPGHEVKVKGIYRIGTGDGYAPSADEPLDVEVRDPRDTVVDRRSLKTNGYGTFTAEVWLPEKAALGTWRVLVTNREKQTFTGTFDVEEYRKPEFTISAKTDRRTYLPGEEVKTEVALRYFFGGPVPGTAVRYTLYRGPFLFDPSEHDEFAWFTKDPEMERLKEQARSEGMDAVSSGEVRTDADGNATVAFRAEDLDGDANYVLAFEALDLNREWVRESASVIVTRQAYYALARTEKKVYRPGEEIAVELTTVDALHFPVAAKGELLVARRTFVDGRETESVVSRADAPTGEDGKATVKVKVERPGEYRLKLAGLDRAGNPVTGAAFVTIAGETEDLAKQAKVVASRQIYREGETAEVLVNSPVAPAWALLTFEGERILDHRVVRLTERSTTLRLLMKPEYSPNVFVRVAIPAGSDLHEAGDEIYVFKYLNVTVAPDRPEAKPGEKVEFALTATDQRGQPVKAELSFSLVDASILALRPDATPQIKPFFYDQRRTLAVRTGSSSTFTYRGSTRPTNKDVLWEELRRQGRDAFNRTMRYLQSGKEYMARGDLENAAIEMRKALQVSPMNYEARELLAQVTTRIVVQRQMEELQRMQDKSKDAKAEKEWSGGYAGRPGAEPAGTPAPQPAKPGAPAPRRAHGDAPAADAAADREGGLDRKRIGGRAGELADSLEREEARIVYVANGFVAFDASPVPARLRERFLDTASWMPRVVTGADGTAKVEVELPDNLTTWRAVVRGVTPETLVGEATASLTARKNLLLRIDAPRFLTQKDRATVTATVHNDLAEEVDVRLTLAGVNVGVDGAAEAGDRLRPRQIRAFDFVLDASGQGLAELTATASTGVESDAAKLGLPVVPHGVRTIFGASGELSEELFFPLDLPDGIVPGTLSLALTLSPGIDASVLESLVYLDAFPYGCLEQTVNRFLPAVAARAALAATGSVDAKWKTALDRAVRGGLLALYSFQNDDGSFGWFGGELVRRAADSTAPPRKGDPLMTAYAILGMERAREAGFEVSEPQRQRALAAGRKLVKEAGTNTEKAFLLHALALGGAADLEDLNQVYRYRDGLDAFSLAALALAMQDTKRPYNTTALVALLKPKAVRENGLVHFEGEDRHGAPNAVETTAYAVRALLAAEPEGDLAADAVRWLMQRKQGPRWSSTRDTGAAVLALADWLVAKGVERSDCGIEVWLNDGAVPYQKLVVAGGKVAGDNARTVLVDGARLKTGRNSVKLVKRGPGRLFATLFASWVTEAEDIAADGNLVRIDRRYVEYVSPVAAKEGKKEIVPGFTIVRPDARPKEETGKTIERAGSGDKFRIRLAVTAKEKLSYVIIEDPLPAGVEVVEGQAAGPFDWAERRDRMQVFFLSDVPEGTTEITYLVQAIHPGAYHALPATAYPMYEPAIHGRSAENRLTVVPESGVVGRPETPEGVTPDEIYQLALRDFAGKEWGRARDALEALLRDFRLLDEYQTECQAMLMRANFELGDHRKAVEAYERLVELTPRRGPETREERRKLAVAYQEIGEFERAVSLFRGVVDEHFALEAAVAETYRGIGQEAAAQAFAEALVAAYPDGNAVLEETWRTALRYLDMKRPETEKVPAAPVVMDAGLLLPEALDAFERFLANYPESSLADEADRMIVSVLNRMERFPEAVDQAKKFIRRHQDSVHLDDVYYYLTESFFGQGEFDQVFETGKQILDRKFRLDARSRALGESPFIPHVRYLFAKTFHHRGDLAKAVELYRMVAGQFEDARDALDFLTKRELDIPETVSFGVGEEVKLPVRRKNLESLDLRVYPIDLMLLVAVKKDLRTANDVDLTGIAPKFTVRREHPDGTDYRWHEDEVSIAGTDGPLGKGVYLVVARAGEIATSSLLVISDLAVSLQQVGDKVRVYATDRKSREPMGDVFVKISDGSEIKAQGFTDARGVFEGRPVSGRLTVVAEKDGHYALERR